METTLTALGKLALAPDWDGDVLAQLQARQPVAMVVDLENDLIDAIFLLKAYKADGCRRDLPILAFASHERDDLLAAATKLGAMAIARSTFASSLVRMLQNLCATDPENGGQAEAS
ncbi:MAG: hypothetical protein H8E15_11820 [Planctomycetes bacterium]|nr:hypothetical protein [Planctomycetota bacterium]